MASSPIPITPQPKRLSPELPDYLPARMVNEFVYCPRLFFYEWVQGVFRESADTLEGSAQHKRVDRPTRGLPSPAALDDEDRIHSRSVELSSETHRVIAKMDLIESGPGQSVVPVDYKHGRPRESSTGTLEIWPADRVQMAVQCLVLRENGYDCQEGVVYYATTRQRVRVEFTEEVISETLAAIQLAWETATANRVPPPLEDSPKCNGCSLSPVCLPDEVQRIVEESPVPAETTQLDLFTVPRIGPALEGKPCRLITPRDDLRPVYLNTPGLRIGKSGATLQVKDKDALLQEIRIGETCQVNLFGNIQVSTQAVQTLCESNIPICYFSGGGWFYGITTGLLTKNVFLRQRQFTLAAQPWFCARLARTLVAGKVRNCRTLLLRNHIEPDPIVLQQLKQIADRLDSATVPLEELLGIEGNAARLYFSQFQGMIKVGDDYDNTDTPAVFRMQFETRNRRPPRDAVNALLSLGYSLLAKDLTVAAYATGFDPMMGFYHQPRFGRPALALDLMEPFRPLIVDSAVLSAINTKMVTPSDLVQCGEAIALTPNGRKGFFRSYELRMNQQVTHPLFGYKVSYRRLLEVQTRLLGKLMDGEISDYPVFVTR